MISVVMVARQTVNLAVHLMIEVEREEGTLSNQFCVPREERVSERS